MSQTADQNTLLEQAIRAFQNKRLDQAEQHCDAILGGGEVPPRAYHLKGVICLLRNRAEAALPHLARAAAAMPRDVDILLGYGRARMLSGDRRGARDTVETCMSLAPERLDVQEALADVLHRDGAFVRALELYRGILAREPMHPTVLTHTGMLLVKMGEVEEGREVLRRAAARWEEPPVLYNLAIDLRDDIEALPGVLDAALQGNREEQLEAIIDPNALEAYQVSNEDLINTILRNNRLIPAGSIDTGVGRFSVKVPSVIEQAGDLRPADQDQR